MSRKEYLQNRMVEILGTEELTAELKAEYEACEAELVELGGWEVDKNGE